MQNRFSRSILHINTKFHQNLSINREFHFFGGPPLNVLNYTYQPQTYMERESHYWKKLKDFKFLDKYELIAVLGFRCSKVRYYAASIKSFHHWDYASFLCNHHRDAGCRPMTLPPLDPHSTSLTHGVTCCWLGLA